MKKLLLLLVFFTSIVVADNQIDSQANCTQLADGDKMSLGNCFNAQKDAQSAFRIGAKFIEKQGWDNAAYLLSPVADINTDGIPETSNNQIPKNVSAYITLTVIKWFGYSMIAIFVWGLLTQSRTGEVFSMQNLYLFAWLFIGGGGMIYFFWIIAMTLGALGISILLIFLAVVVPIIAGLQVKDVKPINNELMVSSQAKAEEIIDDLNKVNVTDFRNRKVILFNNSNESDHRGLKIEDRDFINCLRKSNVQDAGDAAMFTQLDILNTSYCATTVYGYEEYQVGYISNGFVTDETTEIMEKLKSISDRERRGYSYLVERNNCSYAYQFNQGRSKESYAACMDMDVDGNVKFSQERYLKVVSDTPMSGDALKEIRQALVNQLAVDIYTAALKASAKVTPNKFTSGIGGVWDMVNANNEYKMNYRAAGLEVISAITVNTEVRVRKTMIQSALDYSADFFKSSTVVKSDEGANNDYDLQGYATSLGVSGEPVNIFNSINVVTGGAASLTGFNYTDCLNKSNCAIGSMDIAGRLTDATVSVVAPAFSGYLILTVASSVGKSENNKIVGTNKGVGSIEKPAKMGASILYGIALVIGFFYLKFCYELFGRQLFKILDWLFMVLIIVFTMLFAIFGLVISAIMKRKIDMSYFDFIRVGGTHDIAWRPLIMGVSWVGILLVMYVMMGICSILIYTNLQEYVSMYSMNSYSADYLMQGVFHALYVFLFIYTASTSVKVVMDTFDREENSMFSGTQNALTSVDSVFSKIKGLASAK